MRFPREISFRWLLAGIFSGLIVVSTGSVLWLASEGTGQAVRDLAQGQVDASLDSVGSRVKLYFNPANRLLKTVRGGILNGVLALDDPEVMARSFARMLRLEVDLSWFGFGYADGRTASARLDGSKIFAVSSDAGPGELEMRELLPDGNLGGVVESMPEKDFDARKRPWFQPAVDAEGVVWIPPYDFVVGGRGVAASLAVRNAGGELLGVVFADFSLDSISAFLDRVAEQTKGGTLVYLDSGELLAKSTTGVPPEVAERLGAMMKNSKQLGELQNEGQTVFDEVSHGGGSSIVAMREVDLEGGGSGVCVVVFDRKRTFGAVESQIARSSAAAAVVFALSLVLAFFTAKRLSRPLQSLTREMEKIGRFELDSVAPTASSIKEVGILSLAVEKGRNNLKSFSHYVPADIVHGLVKSGTVAARGGERREVTVLFCDIEGFTSYAEKTTPEQAVETLSGCFEVFGRAIHRSGGVIDKFLGDGLMALFNAPSHLDGHAAAACRAAVEAIGELGETGAGKSYVPRVRVGLNGGEALAGNIGTSERFSYTAIGDCVNLASRLEGMNKFYGTSVIASAAIRRAAGDGDFVWRALDRVAVVGRKEPLEIFELVGLRASVGEGKLKMVGTYVRALELYFSKKFAEACELLGEIEGVDSAARVLLARASELVAHPPTENWDGVFRADHK